MILGEIGLLLYLIFTVSAYSIVFLVEVLIVNAMVLVAIINADYNPEYKVSWMAAVLLLPIVGALLYVLFHTRGMRREDERRAREVMVKLEKLDNLDIVREELPEVAEEALGKARALIVSDPTASLYRGASRYYPSGEEMYSDMLLELSLAEKYIFLEYYIIAEGAMWEGILDILKEKAASGVEVRILFDDIGCMKGLPARYERQLSSFGIRAIRFAPASPRVSAVHNNRDHRKIMIVDGKVAFTGGVNIADEYINAIERFGHWKDGGVRLDGNAVFGFVKLFISTWDMAEGSQSDYESLLPAPSEVSDGGFYIPFGSGPSPLYPSKVGKRAIIDIINQAKRYVYITTPYLIIDYDLTGALIGAEERGVDVRIITPGVPDKRLVKVMTKSAYPALISGGVRIYEYTPGFIHEKLIVSDDEYALIGTINMDYRSLVHHFEDALWIYKSPTVAAARAGFEATLAASSEVDPSSARLSFGEWVIKCMLRLFAPLL